MNLKDCLLLVVVLGMFLAEIAFLTAIFFPVFGTFFKRKGTF